MLTTVGLHSALHPTVPTQLVKVKLIKYPNSQPALRSEGPLTEPDAVVACCSRGTQQATTAGESQPVMVTWRIQHHGGFSVCSLDVSLYRGMINY